MDNLCLVTPTFNGGGAEKVIVNLANYYETQSYKVEIIAFRAEGPYLSKVNSNINIIDLNSKKARYVFFKLYKLLKNKKYKYIISAMRDSNIPLGLVGYLQKHNLIFREANTMDVTNNLPFIKKNLYKFLMNLSYKKASKIIANSEDTLNDLILNKIIDKNINAQVIGNPVLPIDVNDLLKEKITHKWFLDKNLKVIVSVGRLVEQKNYPLLLKAFNKALSMNNNLRLVILGEGKLQKELSSLSNKLNIDDKFDILPFQSNPYPYFKNANLFVLSSNWEGFGNVIVESMASSTPIVSTNCIGGPKMILENGKYGSLVPVEDVEVLCSTIINNIKKPNLKQIELAYNKSFYYNVKNIAKEYLK